MHPIVVGHLLPLPDGLAGNHHHPPPFPVLDSVGVAGVIEEGHAGIDGAADWLHGESIITGV